MFLRNRRGFTLVELLVVMAIIGILAAALTTQVSRARETARAMRCKANLRNLAQAALNYGVDNRRLPWAGSHEWQNAVRVGNSFQTRVELRRGWVDWTTGAGTVERWPKPYSGGPSFSGRGSMVTAMEGRAAFSSVTNGTLWTYMGRDMSAYLCDAHVADVRAETRRRADVRRSYFMNGYFGYNKDYMPIVRRHRDIWLNNLADRGRAASLLLFAELPVTQRDVSDSQAVDGVIETVIVGYNDGADTATRPPRESIGFNHRVGRRRVAHVAFADGHVDVVHAPPNVTDAQMKGLTYFLCNGYEAPVNIADWRVP